jgi:hypothetical protein
MQLFAEFVATVLESPAAEPCRRYLIIDAAATRPTNMARELGLGTQAFDILTDKACDWRESASPVLIELPADNANAHVWRSARELLTRWRYANCFVYVETLHGPEEALRMLRQRTEAVLPQNMSVILRYFDPRVFSVLLRAWDADRLQSFLSAGVRWAIPGRRGELQLIECDHSAPTTPFTAPLNLSTTEEATLIDASEADAIVCLLLNQNNSVLQTLLPPEQYEQVSAALDAAKTFRIEQVPDQATFCACALAQGLGFCELPPWAALMPEVRAGRLKFADVAARVAGGKSS